MKIRGHISEIEFSRLNLNLANKIFEKGSWRQWVQFVLSREKFYKSKRIMWTVACGAKKTAYKLFLGKPAGKRPLGRPRLGGWVRLRWFL
jgi:hypothetical protein